MRLHDPRHPGTSADGGVAVGSGHGSAQGAARSSGWTRGLLESGAPFWWRESEVELDGVEVRLGDPATDDATRDATSGAGAGPVGEEDGG